MKKIFFNLALTAIVATAGTATTGRGARTMTAPGTASNPSVLSPHVSA